MTRSLEKHKRNRINPTARTESNGRNNARPLQRDALRAAGRLGSAVIQAVKDGTAKVRQSAANGIKQRGDKLSREIGKRIAKRPLSSILATACVGLVIGMLCARRR